jgi:hypothetical protein
MLRLAQTLNPPLLTRRSEITRPSIEQKYQIPFDSQHMREIDQLNWKNGSLIGRKKNKLFFFIVFPGQRDY